MGRTWTTNATKSFRSVVLFLSIALTSSCHIGGSYFHDDGLRLAHDAKTGEYIGERIDERKVRDKETAKDVVYYKIRRSDGSVVEMPAEEVKLSKP